ncbi:MAG: hypothetical protein BWY60_00288 [Actinobacteria bacterium ADurb.Bin346]|nr:MAG: hypothetical protein BWY60_00288 [Actinobacteria bacterium ADurb.Bin346]
MYDFECHPGSTEEFIRVTGAGQFWIYNNIFRIFLKFFQAAAGGLVVITNNNVRIIDVRFYKINDFRCICAAINTNDKAILFN